jgi:hypothetical protein
MTDFLTEDKPLTNQKYVLISFLTNSFLKANDLDTDDVKEEKRKKYNELTTKGIKIRGCFETYEEALSRAEYLKEVDQYHNIYIGEIGKWLPFEDDPEKAQSTTYGNESLNKLMQEYHKEQEKGNKAWEARKNQMVKEALLKNEENRAKVIENKKTDIEVNLEKTNELVEDNEKTLEDIKLKINNEEQTIYEKKKNLKKINKELEEAKKLLANLKTEL